MRYVFWRRVRHNYFTSFTISLNRKRWIVSIKILIFYGHLITFSQSLRVLWIYAPLWNTELVRKEEALYLRFLTQGLKIRKFWISCCDYTGLIHSLYYTSVYHSVHTKYTGTLYLLIHARFMQQNCLICLNRINWLRTGSNRILTEIFGKLRIRNIFRWKLKLKGINMTLPWHFVRTSIHRNIGSKRILIIAQSFDIKVHIYVRISFRI